MIDPAVPAVRVRDVSKRFGTTVALDSFSLDVWRGGTLTLLGPSGCGKTTALRVIAGFERPERGTVEIDGRVATDESTMLQPEKRRVGMVFQDYALFPHLTVAGNIAYGLSRRSDSNQRVQDLLDLVGLPGLGDRMPHELSGGQQQRVALARALAPEPDVILLDEPFSNLDASLRDRVRRELKGILTAANTTAVFVTHDQEEALAMSDLVAVMRAGRIIQAASPDQLYLRPADPWVAGFLGDADFLSGHASGGRVETPVGVFDTSDSGPVLVMIRPESVTLAPNPKGNGQVVEREFYGHDQLVTVAVSNHVTIRSRLGPVPHLQPGDKVEVVAKAAVTFPV